MDNRHFILKGHEVVPVSLEVWASWFSKDTRRVALTRVSQARIYQLRDIRFFRELHVKLYEQRSHPLVKLLVREFQFGHSVDVSTVFLGLDHNWGGGPPLLFETMIFTDGEGGYCRRYSAWEEAEAGHWETVRMLDWHKKEFWQAKLDDLRSFWEWRIAVPIEGLIHRFQRWVNTPK